MLSSSNAVEKRGYLDIKQPARGRGLRIKAWKRKWLVIHQMSDLAAGQYVAKIEIFTDEEAYKKKQEKDTIYLENITLIRRTKSKSHPFAFEVIEDDPVLYLSGQNETETQSWLTSLRRIFWPFNPQDLYLEEPDTFEVAIIDNTDSEKLGLCGTFIMSVNPRCISVHNPKDGAIVHSWRLAKLKRFYLLCSGPAVDSDKILVILAGKSESMDEGEYQFFTYDAPIILRCIFDSVTAAMGQTKNSSIPTQENCDHALNESRLKRGATLISTPTSYGIPEASKCSPSRSTTVSDTVSICSQQRPTPNRAGSLPPHGIATPNRETPIMPQGIPTPNRTASNPPLPPRTPRQLSSSPHTSSPIISRKPLTDNVFSEEYNQLTFAPLVLKKVSPVTARRQTFSHSTGNVSHPTLPHSSSDNRLASKIKSGDDGYSHIEFTPSVSDKDRTMSNSSVMSSMSSVSKDSGVTIAAAMFEDIFDTSEIRKDSNGSGDSAFVSLTPRDRNVVSTDSKPDNHLFKRKVSGVYHTVDEDDISTETPVILSSNAVHRKISTISHTYADLDAMCSSDIQGQIAEDENVYEELSAFKKDISKFLGMGEPTLPPALPERPPSLQNSPEVGRRKNKRSTWLGIRKRRSKTADSISSSSVSSDEEDVNFLIQKMESLPLDDASTDLLNQVQKLGEWPLSNSLDDTQVQKVGLWPLRSSPALRQNSQEVANSLYATSPQQFEMHKETSSMEKEDNVLGLPAKLDEEANESSTNPIQKTSGNKTFTTNTDMFDSLIDFDSDVPESCLTPKTIASTNIAGVTTGGATSFPSLSDTAWVSFQSSGEWDPFDSSWAENSLNEKSFNSQVELINNNDQTNNNNNSPRLQPTSAKAANNQSTDNNLNSLDWLNDCLFTTHPRDSKPLEKRSNPFTGDPLFCKSTVPTNQTASVISNSSSNDKLNTVIPNPPLQSYKHCKISDSVIFDNTPFTMSSDQKISPVISTETDTASSNHDFDNFPPLYSSTVPDPFGLNVRPKSYQTDLMGLGTLDAEYMDMSTRNADGHYEEMQAQLY